MKKLYLFIALVLLWFTHGSFAATDLEQKLEIAFDSYVTKLGQKSISKQLTTLQSLGTKIDNVLETKKLSTQKRDIIEFLWELINDAILQSNLDNQKQAFKGEYQLNNLHASFDNKITNDADIFLENGVWYFYRYSKWGRFKNDNYAARDLDANWFTPENTLLDIRDDKVVFINSFEKIRLINDSIISGVADKYSFLKEIKDDKRFLSDNTDFYFLQLKKDTRDLIWSETNRQQKIQKIYNFVLSNVSYTLNVDLEDRKIFSWIESYKNKQWVCEWYSKLMVYMLWFAWIWDYEAIRWYVIDAPDFVNNIWHAWVRIGDQYYDPTFDDPIWLSETRPAESYLYYNMPKDLFYTNRYHYDDLPEKLRDTTIEYRNSFIQTRMANLLSKYDPKTYLVLKPFAFKKQIWVAYTQDIRLSDLKKIMDTYQVQNGRLTEDGRAISSQSSSFAYYKITTDNISTILKQIDYQVDDHFIVQLEDNSYGIGYGVN